MSVGRTISLAEINNAAGGIAGSLFATMDNITKMKAVLDGYTAQNLVDSFGFTLADANILKSAFTDMANVVALWTGVATSGTVPRDHRTFAKQLLGTGLY